jgi:hypothetical protein
MRPLKHIARDDADMLKDIETFARMLYHHSILKRSQGLDARVLDAVIAIQEDPKYEKYLHRGSVNGWGNVLYAFTRDIAVVANIKMDEMNLGEEEEGADEDEKKKRRGKSLTTKTTSDICQDTLMLPAHRVGKGYVIIFDDDKLEVAKLRYGLTDELRAAMRGDDQPVVEELPQGKKQFEQDAMFDEKDDQ